MSRPIDFWFSIGSTYTYLTVMRIGDVTRETGVSFRWRPFDVRSIMIEMNNIPFSTKPIKASYMWRDIERRAAMYGITWSGIPPYPLKDLAFANRIALIGAREGWCADYVAAVYRRWFGRGEDASMAPNITDSLKEVGQEPRRVIELAGTDQINTELDNQTNIARQLGIFGAPTFAVGSEIFWGDDRLDDAIAWQREQDSSLAS
jgi:2-hydroxychromene-2-carboxylate isomerase